jgi:hypothetical protein
MPPSRLWPVLRFVIPLALFVVVLVAAATVPAHRARDKTVRHSACVQSDRQLASAACR